MVGENSEATAPLASVSPKVAALCGAFSTLTGAVVIVIGWGLNVNIVRALVPGTVEMKPSTAVMFMLCGIALLLARVSDRWRWIGWTCSIACVLIALTFLSEYVIGWRLGIDEMPFRDTFAHATHIANPGRPAPTTLVCFVLTGVALFALHTRWRIEEVLMVPVAAVATMCLVGYAYSIPAFYGPASAAKMALNTGIAFLAVAVGVLFAQDDGRSQRALTSTDPGIVMARRLIPLALLVPLSLGWLRLLGADAGIFGLRMGTWLLTMSTIVCLIAVIAWAAASLSRTDAHRRRLESELQRLAGEDELTHLANRRGFVERLNHELALAGRHGSPGALLMIDLDQFKAINDTHGHAAGDELLRRISEVLEARLRDTDALGRLGGDEFVVYLPQTDADAGARVAEHLLTAVSDASAELGDGMRTTSSIGVAFDSSSSHGPEVMLKAADRAMYRAKRAGGNRVDAFEPSAPVANVGSASNRRRSASPESHGNGALVLSKADQT
jgi:diguanylate cyclase (GGDEF)-like protein